MDSKVCHVARAPACLIRLQVTETLKIISVCVAVLSCVSRQEFSVSVHTSQSLHEFVVAFANSERRKKGGGEGISDSQIQGESSP